MKRSQTSWTLLRMAAAAAILGVPRPALSQAAQTPPTPEGPKDETRVCVDAYEAAQKDRLGDDLLKAREELRLCDAPACPPLIQSDCTGWWGQVAELIPSVIFTAKVDDDPVFDVAVSIDGVRSTAELDGKKVEVNPGLHTFVFERRAQPRIEKKLIIAPREVAQVVAVVWKSRATPTAAAAPPDAKQSRGLSTGRILGWGSLGLGVAGIAVGSVTGALTLGASSSADSACPRNMCRAGGLDDISRAKTDATVSTIAFAVGGAATALGLYLVLRPEHRAASTIGIQSLTLAPMASSREGGAWLRGRFQ